MTAKRRAITRSAVFVVLLALSLCLAQTTQPSTNPVQGPTRWEAEIAQFEAQDARTPPPEHPIVFVGSSSIRLWKTSQAFADLPTLNRGFGGSGIDDVIYYAPRIVAKYKPRTIVFYSGDNDIAAGRSAEVVAGDFERFLKIVRKQLPETKLIVIGIKPSIKRWEMIEKMRDANRRIRAMLETDPNAVFISVEEEMLGSDGRPKPELFRDDGLHMNEKGYEIWNRLLKPYLQ